MEFFNGMSFVEKVEDFIKSIVKFIKAFFALLGIGKKEEEGSEAA